MLSFFPVDVLDEILDVIESVSEGFLTYYCSFSYSVHFVQRSGTILAILAEGHPKSGHCPRRCHSKKLLTEGRRTNIDHNSSL